MPPVTARAAPSAPVPTPTKTGPRSPTLQSDGAYKIESPNATIVSEPNLILPARPLIPTLGKKLKRRLEDLERRAASSSASPEQSHQELVTVDDQDQETKRARLSRQSSSATQIKRCLSPEPSLDDFPLLNDEPKFMFQEQSPYSSSSASAFAYSTYPPADTMYYGAYSQPSSLPMSQAPYFDNMYATSLHSTLPIMPSSRHNVKQEALFPEDDLLSPFSMTYASLTGIDVNHSQAYSDASAHVNAPYFFPSTRHA